jgi:hypothetical protein
MEVDLHSKIVLLFTGAGGLAGVISAFLPSGWLALGLAFLFFYLVYKRAPQLLKFQPSEFPPVRVAKTGFFPLFIMWFIAWVAVYTMIVTG